MHARLDKCCTSQATYPALDFLFVRNYFILVAGERITVKEKGDVFLAPSSQ
jgi:hypothetical protein